jgi:diacylglycerol kinase family enzyme
LDRGLVAITFKTLKVGAVLGGLGGALRGGGMKSSDTVDVQTDLSCLSVTSTRPFPFQLDGDYLGETLELKFEHRPNAVKLVYPSPAV